MKIGSLSLLLASAATIFVAPLAAAPFSSTVHIDSGVIEGVPALTANVMVYEGIPFAAPPVGNLRWKAPQPVAPWPAVRNADRYGPACMQYYMEANSTANFGDYETKSEDCLYLNVWTPAKTAADKLPVLVWIHGGGFRVGSATERLHHGDNLAAKGVVAVTLNYRLGIFGFFAHPELSSESGHHASGNYGLMDQIAALQWVKRNIAAFGGDPGRVTIFGESAGAGAVSYLQATPMTEGLFQGAIGESGGSFARPAPGSVSPLESAEQNGTKFAAAVGASSLAELRAMTGDQILRAGNAFGSFSPFVDGYVLPQDVYTTFAEGKQHDVPVLVGSNSDEGTTLRGRPPMLTSDANRDELAKLYPPEKQAKITSGSMLWAMHTWARLQTQTGKHKAYQYYFSHPQPFPKDAKFQIDVSNLGAFHSSEIIYVFDNLAIRKARDWPWTPVDWKLADTMSSYWVNFATKGDPNGPGLPAWPAYDEANQQVMNFGDPVQTIAMPRTNELKFWDKVNHSEFSAPAFGAH
jgi:para-nitrobenzyl esterase